MLVPTVRRCAATPHPALRATCLACGLGQVAALTAHWAVIHYRALRPATLKGKASPRPPLRRSQGEGFTAHDNAPVCQRTGAGGETRKRKTYSFSPSVVLSAATAPLMRGSIYHFGIFSTKLPAAWSALPADFLMLFIFGFFLSISPPTVTLIGELDVPFP